MEYRLQGYRKGSSTSHDLLINFEEKIIRESFEPTLNKSHDSWLISSTACQFAGVAAAAALNHWHDHDQTNHNNRNNGKNNHNTDHNTDHNHDHLDDHNDGHNDDHHDSSSGSNGSNGSSSNSSSSTGSRRDTSQAAGIVFSFFLSFSFTTIIFSLGLLYRRRRCFYISTSFRASRGGI